MFKKLLLTLSSALILYINLSAQIIILDADGDGGFESGTTFAANGWSVANGTQKNKWNVGSAPSGFTGNRCAYISQDNGNTHTYDISASSKVHLYRDVDLTGYAAPITLQFDWKGLGETDWDYIEVFKINTNNTPTAGSNLNNPRTSLGGKYDSQNSWSTESISLDAYAGTNIRLVFFWSSGTINGDQFPGAIDNVMIYQGVLPLSVELASFSGKCDGDDHIIEWVTETETNNDYFTIESTDDGSNWQQVGYMDGAGDSDQAIYYNYRVTKSINNSEQYYRLKQTDFDGKFVYSGVINVNQYCEELSNAIVIYPSPSTGYYSVISDHTIKSLRVTNLLGEIIYADHTINNSSVKFDISSYPKGLYIVEINSRDNIIKQRIIKK